MLVDVWDRLLASPKGGEWGASPWTIIGSFLACSGLLALIDSTGCCLPRHKLKRPDRIEWNVRIVSSVHAIVLVIGTHETLLQPCYALDPAPDTSSISTKQTHHDLAGAWLTWEETRNLSDYDSIFRMAWAPDFFARIFIGYLVYDMAVMIWYYSELQDPTAILHHFIFLMAATYVVAHSIMAFLFSWLAFTEVSTPFLNVR